MSYNNSNDELRDEDSRSGVALDLTSLWKGLVEKAWVVALCLLAAAFITYGYLKRAEVIYASTATLAVEEPSQILRELNDPGRGIDLDRPEDLKTIIESLKSRPIIERVIAENKLEEDVRLVGPEKGRFTHTQVINLVNQFVTPRMRPGTRLIDVTVQHPDAELTVLLANSIITAFLQHRFQQQMSASDVAEGFYVQQERQLQETNRVLETQVQDYKLRHPGVSEEEQAQLAKEVNELSQRLTTARIGIQAIERDSQLMRGLNTNLPALLNLAAVASDPTVVQARSEVARISIDFEQVKRVKKPKHPDYQQIQGRLVNAEDILTNAVMKVVSSVEARLQSARAEETGLKTSLEALESRRRDLEKILGDYNVLLGKLKFNRELLERVAKDRRVSNVTKTINKDPVRIEQKAVLPEKPVKPNRKQVMLMGGIAGLLGAILFALGLTALDSSLKSIDQAERFLKLPVLGAIPQMKRVQAGDAQVIMNNPDLVAGAEAFRSLRTTLMMLGPIEERRTFLFTSAVPDEGKTFCTINFAYSLAQQGLRTLLIDCDLRCPTVEEYLVGKATRHAGVTDYLAGRKVFADLLQRTRSENFCFISAGGRASNPSELLAQNRFQALLDEALQYFDQVVVDSAPVHPVSDTLLLANRVKTVCVVVRANHTPRKAAATAIQKLVKVRAPIAGFLLNGISPLHQREYYDYSDYYGRYRESEPAEETADKGSTPSSPQPSRKDPRGEPPSA